jgi:divinyl protochlorophyllide a 8-vinyl-reductase
VNASGPASGRDAGRIGPNAVVRLAEALESQVGRTQARAVFLAAGQPQFLAAAPEAMVDECVVTALYASLRGTLGSAAAAVAARRAGELTGDYLLARRIPAAVRGVLKMLPSSLAAPLLVDAIRRHAWTFAGSGRFTVAGRRPLRLSITGCPICRGASSPTVLCDYYAATFERLFAALVCTRCTVRETGCAATGSPACVFEVRW